MKRSFLLYFLISVIGVLFIGRLFQLQILKSRDYNPVKNSAVKVMFDFPERGYIYDRNSELLVANQLSYRVEPNHTSTRPLCSSMHILLCMPPTRRRRAAQVWRHILYISLLPPLPPYAIVCYIPRSKV